MLIAPFARCLAVALVVLVVGACRGNAPAASASQLYQQPYEQAYEHEETRALVRLVNEAAQLVHSRGESAFADLRIPSSRWRQGETYIFVLDPQGNMLVHPDATMEGKNQIDLKDVDGRPIIRGLIDAATAIPGKPEGWYHYQWPVPGGLLARWKSSFVHSVTTPSGKTYVVGSGVYNDRMERAFVVDLVKDAVSQIEKNGEAAFPLFRAAKGRFIAKDAYVFVIDPNGIDLVNPAFPNLEGRSLLDLKDTRGKRPIREMLDVVRTTAAGWVDYMWPKPGDSVSTQKSAFVSKANVGGKWLLVGCGVYLADAPRGAPVATMTAPDLMALVRDGAAVLAKTGENAFPEFRVKGSRWLHDGTYFFVWDMDGTRLFHATDLTLEGTKGSDAKDVHGRPYGKMLLDVAASTTGEGWVHYMYPEPGNIFPAWKSTFVKRVTFPSGRQRVVGCGVYDMKMDKALIEDVVNRASALVAERGREAFGQLRDRTGPFVFMDTYVFVDSPDGVELVNPAQPSLEGKNLIDMRDLNGKALAQDYIATAMRDGSGWVQYAWYKPGTNTLAAKHAFVRRTQSGRDVFIVGSGVYID